MFRTEPVGKYRAVQRLRGFRRLKAAHRKGQRSGAKPQSIGERTSTAQLRHLQSVVHLAFADQKIDVVAVNSNRAGKKRQAKFLCLYGRARTLDRGQRFLKLRVRLG